MKKPLKSVIVYLILSVFLVISVGPFALTWLTAFKSQRVKVNGDLSRVTSLLPGTVDLNSVGYGKSFEISGTAPDEATILGYARALRDTNRFAQVVVSNMRKSEYNKWDFTLMLK